MAFSHQPAKPKAKCCERAFLIFQTGYATCESFLNSFEQVRKDRNARGAPADLEQDLLRAMVVFACSTLDSIIKQLIRDALPTVIEKNEGAEAQFRSFIERRIGQDQKLSMEIIALTITSRSPREQTMNRFISILTQDSLQSKDQIFQITSFFDIPSRNVCAKPDDLRDVFRVRNKIIHELDIDSVDARRTRVSRRKAEMVDHVNTIFQTASSILAEVDQRCT